MTGIEEQVVINTTNIAMMLKMFWIIMGGVAVNIFTTIYSKNGRSKK